MLRVERLNAWYGASHVLQDLDLEVNRGEIVCLIGRNGAGKTTMLKSIIGLIPKTRGSITFEDRELLGTPVHARFGLGLGYVPEERRIVQGLSVRENLRLGLVASPQKGNEAALIDRIAGIFPRLAERLDQTAVTMSGGEQQMLAIARAMISSPKLIMLDEPSEGIMPVLVDEMFELFRSLNRRAPRSCWSNRMSSWRSTLPTASMSSTMAAWCIPARLATFLPTRKSRSATAPSESRANMQWRSITWRSCDPARRGYVMRACPE